MSAPAHRFTATDVAFKTVLGRREMVEREHGLSPFERTLLVIVDGRQDFAALFAALGRDANDAEAHAALARLFALGLLERRGPPAAGSRRSLALARLYLIDSMERALRGRTEDLLPQLKAATDEASLLRVLRLCEQRLQAAGAASQAAAIRTRCLELLPAPELSRTVPPATEGR